MCYNALRHQLEYPDAPCIGNTRKDMHMKIKTFTFHGGADYASLNHGGSNWLGEALDMLSMDINAIGGKIIHVELIPCRGFVHDNAVYYGELAVKVVVEVGGSINRVSLTYTIQDLEEEPCYEVDEFKYCLIPEACASCSLGGRRIVNLWGAYLN